MVAQDGLEVPRAPRWAGHTVSNLGSRKKLQGPGLGGQAASAPPPLLSARRIDNPQRGDNHSK